MDNSLNEEVIQQLLSGEAGVGAVYINPQLFEKKPSRNSAEPPAPQPLVP